VGHSILAVLPVSAVFILFDLVIHNPRHPESQTNLLFLETAAGYFSLVDIASNNALPGSLMAEFPHIARQYYWNAQKPVVEGVAREGLGSTRGFNAGTDRGLGMGIGIGIGAREQGNGDGNHNRHLVCFARALPCPPLLSPDSRPRPLDTNANPHPSLRTLCPIFPCPRPLR
jgi:hypothetical protein